MRTHLIEGVKDIIQDDGDRNLCNTPVKFWGSSFKAEHQWMRNQLYPCRLLCELQRLMGTFWWVSLGGGTTFPKEDMRAMKRNRPKTLLLGLGQCGGRSWRGQLENTIARWLSDASGTWGAVMGEASFISDPTHGWSGSETGQESSWEWRASGFPWEELR